MLAKRNGDLAAAQALFEQALQFEARLGKPHGIASTLQELAETLDARGQRDAALSVLARRGRALAHERDLFDS